MRILELTTLTAPRQADLLALMRELDPTIDVTGEMLLRAAESPSTHLFVALDEAGAPAPGGPVACPADALPPGRIVGCASLCVFDSPTGRKASVEDVVVASTHRGRGIGRALLEHLVDYARRELAPIDLHLTSRPSRVAANELYRSLGFQPRATNPYRLTLLPPAPDGTE